LRIAPVLAALALFAASTAAVRLREDPLKRTSVPARMPDLLVDFPRQVSEVVGNAGCLPSAQPPCVLPSTTLLRGDVAQVRQAALPTRDGLRIELPAQAEEAMRISLPGFELEVRERDAYGPVRQVAGAVAYSRRDGTSYWRASETGYEEWLLLSNAGEGPVATWELRGGLLRMDGESVVVADASGRPRLRVSAPRAYAVGGEPARAWLRAVGTTLEVHTSARGAVLVDPLWTTVGSMSVGRSLHTATRLLSGKVLVVGGCCDSNTQVFASAELYDPATSTWSTTGSLAEGRARHGAVLLPSGKVLVVGGTSQSGYLASSEVYDPATGTWSSTGTLPAARIDPAATLLLSGKVLVAGGADSTGLTTSALLYDPSTGAWTSTGDLVFARDRGTATLLTSGRVLVSGGQAANDYATATAELYDPATGTWTQTGSLTEPRAYDTATLLPSGQVLVVGGSNDNAAELYDPGTGTWSVTGSTSVQRYYHTATLLPSGDVLVVGAGSAVAEVYTPATGTWSVSGSLSIPRDYNTATPLVTGQVLVTGGEYAQAYLSSAEVYDPQDRSAPVISPPHVTLRPDAVQAFTVSGGSGGGYRWVLVSNASGGSVSATGAYTAGPTGGGVDVLGVTDSLGSFSTATAAVTVVDGWSAVGMMSTPRDRHTATLLPSGKVLVAGSGTQYGMENSAELYDPALGTWTPTGSLLTGRYYHTATLLSSGQVLAAGGETTGTSAGSGASAELYDVASGTWSATGSMTSQRVSHTATLLPSGKVLAVGGCCAANNQAFASAEVYDPATGLWSATGSLAVGRSNHTATLLPTGKVLVAGGTGQAGELGGSELYDPATGAWTLTGTLNAARASHSAVLLASGQVLVLGGLAQGGLTASAELYDPATGLWSLTGFLSMGSQDTTATLLPSGQVLAVGGFGGTPLSTSLAAAELFDPVAGTWSPTGALNTARDGHTATLLPSGGVLVAGGSASGLNPEQASAELYDEGGSFAFPSPVLSGGPARVAAATTFRLHGSGFRGASEGASGTTSSSATNYPLVELEPASGGGVRYAPVTAFTDTDATARMPVDVPSGPWQLRVNVSGVPSAWSQTNVLPALLISPASVVLPAGGTQGFTASGGTAAGYHWSLSTNNSGGSIDGATGAYTAGATGSVDDAVEVADSDGNTATATVSVTSSSTPPAQSGCSTAPGESFPTVLLTALFLLGSSRRRVTP
jgi:large repetitive protein